MKIHSSIFLGIPVHLWWISPTVWHTSASIRDISTTCDANATLSIHLQSGGAIAVQRNHTGCYLATGAQRPRTACVYLGWGYFELYISYCPMWMDFAFCCRCSWKTFPFLPQTPIGTRFPKKFGALEVQPLPDMQTPLGFLKIGNHKPLDLTFVPIREHWWVVSLDVHPAKYGGFPNGGSPKPAGFNTETA